MIDESNKSSKKGIYITGGYNDLDRHNPHAGYWLDGIWNTLVTPPDAVNSGAFDIFIAGTDVYIAGWYENETFWHNGYWKNGAWHNMSKITGEQRICMNISVNANGDVYLVGSQTELKSVPKGKGKTHAGYLLNNVWHDLPVQSDCFISWATGICIANGKVYISGYHNSRPCYWVNGTCHELPIITDFAEDGM